LKRLLKEAFSKMSIRCFTSRWN